MMTNPITSNTRRLGRVLVVLILAVAALVLLLSTWSRLPTAEARGPAEADTGGSDLLLSSRSLLTYYVFLPILFKSDYVFFDDFSDSNSGWPHDESFEDCHYEYRSGHYQVKVTDRNQHCIIPNFRIPRQFYGTFKIRARRTSDEDRKLGYGFIFDAGKNATEDEGTRWSLEVYPNEYDACNDKPFFWLIALKNGNAKFRNYEESPDDHECTNSINTDDDEDAWNELMVIRKGDNIKVYINGQLKGNYDDVPELDDNEQSKLGYFLLRAVSLSDEDVTIEYDDLEILRTTTAP
jgi:hypothetical protein